MESHTPADPISPINDRQIIGFYLGSLISSVGSMTYTVCVMYFMADVGFPLASIGLVIGFSRFVPIFVNLFFGEIADSVSPRTVLLWSEIFASLMSLALIASWNGRSTNLFAFAFFGTARACILVLQGPSRAKISKQISGDDYKSNSIFSIWLNKVTHGAAFFAAIVALAITTYGSLRIALLFDFASFILNGAVIWRLSVGKSIGQKAGAFLKTLRGKFKSLYQFSPRAAILDLLLATALCGLNIFSVRIAGAHKEFIPLYLGSYGFAVWITGFMERVPIVKRQHTSVWFALGLLYIALGKLAGTGWPSFFLFFCSDTCYWILFHRYTSRIQMDVPFENTAAAFSARSVQMITVLSLGEFLVGAWSPYVSVAWDGAIRGLLCLLVASALIFLPKPKLEQDAGQI